MPVGAGSLRWYAGYLMEAGPPWSATLARAALRTIVREVRINGLDEQTSPLASLVQRAQQTLEEAQPALVMQPVSLLAAPFETSPTGSITVSNQAMTCWRQPGLGASNTLAAENDTWWEQLGQQP